MQALPQIWLHRLHSDSTVRKGAPAAKPKEEQDSQQGPGLAPHLNSCGSQKSTTSFFQSFSSVSSANVCALLFTRR